MASFERFNDMYDSKLKPKILRNVLSEYVPNEKQPLVSFLSIGRVDHLHTQAPIRASVVFI
ncbi:hypothetical protein Bca52824_034814 [Brassica carinata]|uniref:Uncharacterized protein n=1 Tax=Brassica carinata TaxID=52824 RepID=A0A8X7S200_BRACI|nr:hypothetical protein Bca52824_034814 [Brassica carinata]